jgi:glycosyltransferase involved in cell wall biosynthesis
MKLDIVLPIYNEEKILNNSLNALLQYCEDQLKEYGWIITLAVNGSRDSSEKIAKDFAAKHPAKINFLSLKEPGKGRAIITAWTASEADVLIFMDADLSVSLDNTDLLLRALTKENYDLAIGSRFLAGAETTRAKKREYISRIYNIFSRALFNHSLTDMQCGFKAIKKSEFENLKSFLKNQEWFFDTELLIYANAMGLKIKEIPVDWRECRYNKRKTKANIYKNSLVFLGKLLLLKYKILTLKKAK